MNGKSSKRAPAGALIGALVLVAAVAGTPELRAHCLCPADCDADCTTSLEELERVVRGIFEPSALAGCPVLDANGDGTVSAADIPVVTRAVVDPPPECAAPATVFPTPTPTMRAAQTPTDVPPPTVTPAATAIATPTFTPTIEATPASSWTTLAPLAAGARQEVGVAALDGTIYVIGGFDGEGRVEAYSVANDRWQRVANLPAPRNHAGAGTLAARVYSVGGFAGTGFTPTGEVYRYDPASDRWETVAPLPTIRGALAVAVAGGGIHAVGGSGVGGSVARHDRYDPESDSWTELAPLPSARNHLAAVSIEDTIYVVGGRMDGGGERNTGELARYDPETDSWEILAPMPTARSGLAAAVVDGRLVVLGGEVNPSHPQGVFPQVELYDPSTNRWTPLDPMPVPRHGIGAASVGGLIYVPGGATVARFGATAHHDAVLIEGLSQ